MLLYVCLSLSLPLNLLSKNVYAVPRCILFVIAPNTLSGRGFDDLIGMLAEWGACSGCSSDIDGNGQVDFNDLLTLLGNWS